MRRHLKLLMLILSLIAPMAMAEPASTNFIVIVNQKNSLTSIDKKQLADLYLKKTTRWSNGETVKPADLAPNSNLRKSFTENVLKRTVSEMKNYWTQRIFSGNDLPPAELDSESKMVQFVSSNPAAVGYVSSDANLKGVKILTVK